VQLTILKNKHNYRLGIKQKEENPKV
jgi:hypothetical protein